MVKQVTDKELINAIQQAYDDMVEAENQKKFYRKIIL